MTKLARRLDMFVFPAGLGRGFRAGMVLLLALVLHACATTDPRLTTALKQTSVAEIRVETAPDVRMGGLFYQGKPDPQLPTVTRTLETAMRNELIGLPGGPVRGRLVVTLHVDNVSSDAGRVLIGTDSSIEGIVRLENTATGELIAQSRSIRAQDRGMKGGGLGVIVAVAVNAAAVAGQPDALPTRLSASFTRQVKAWLTQK